MKKGSRDTFLVSKDFFYRSTETHKGTISIIRDFFFLTPKPLVKLLFLQVLFHCKFIVYLSIRNCSLVCLYHLVLRL